mmetsp:Transcript_4069/g.9751  ORF Transcript_4069/g.9751 Transcript_4069/m.9751 type:complete len:253 (-) Transcript_4069:636-1394(-)
MGLLRLSPGQAGCRVPVPGVPTERAGAVSFDHSRELIALRGRGLCRSEQPTRMLSSRVERSLKTWTNELKSTVPFSSPIWAASSCSERTFAVVSTCRIHETNSVAERPAVLDAFLEDALRNIERMSLCFCCMFCRILLVTCFNIGFMVPLLPCPAALGSIAPVIADCERVPIFREGDEMITRWLRGSEVSLPALPRRTSASSSAHRSAASSAHVSVPPVASRFLSISRSSASEFCGGSSVDITFVLVFLLGG